MTSTTVNASAVGKNDKYQHFILANELNVLREGLMHI